MQFELLKRIHVVTFHVSLISASPGLAPDRPRSQRQLPPGRPPRPRALPAASEPLTSREQDPGMDGSLLWTRGSEDVSLVLINELHLYICTSELSSACASYLNLPHCPPCPTSAPQALPPGLTRLSALTSLDVSSNEIEDLPAGLAGLRALQHIRVWKGVRTDRQMG